MNQNWIVENLNNAFSTWNGKLTELWGLVTTSPQTFKGGAVWGVMQSLHNAMIGIIITWMCLDCKKRQCCNGVCSIQKADRWQRSAFCMGQS